MRIFISAGEPSGDLHAANLIGSLRRQYPDARFEGFGGERMTAAGAHLLYPLANLAVMWFLQVFLNIVTFIRLVFMADRHFRDHKPDAVVLVDYPGLHWWIAARAKARGIPVFYFVPPQIWAWAGWRVKKVRRSIDLVLCSLPFEPPWYHARGSRRPFMSGIRISTSWRSVCSIPLFSASKVRSGAHSWRSFPARGRRKSRAICRR